MKALYCLGASLLSLTFFGANPCLAQSPPVTNNAPVVDIVTPGDGSIFLTPVTLYVCATTAYFTNTVLSVEFLAGTNVLGVVSNAPPIILPLPAGGEEMLRPYCPDFCVTWSNVPPGSYALTAIATDLAGNTATSPVVDISVVTNLPPRVVITKPKNGATILGPTNIGICATAFNPERGTVTQVEFFEGTNSLGVVTNVPVIYVTNKYGVFPIQNISYCLKWSNAPAGAYTLTAVATDNDGASTTSSPVDITVVTNLPPKVRIETPEHGAKYHAPATVEICAAASQVDGTVTQVEFFAGTNTLGVVTNSTVITNKEGTYDLFCFTWSGVAAGSYTLTAVATDNAGATTTSSPVGITVLTPPQPSVRIITDGTTFFAPANIWICSATSYFPDRVASVQYLAGTNSLATVANWPSFCFDWTNVPAGSYVLTATATDVSGSNVVTSLPEDITVKTNRPPPPPQH